MLRKSWLFKLAVAAGFGTLFLFTTTDSRADEWGRYYHWPYSNFHQYYWSPYEYRQVYDNNYRYPAHMRRYPTVDEWRNWSTVKKPWYRGYHFILDQF